MAPPEPSVPEQQSLLLLLPSLLTALGIILCVSLTLLALHFLIKKLRSRNPPTAVPQTTQACLGVDSKVLDSLTVHAYDDKDSQRECCVCLSALEEGVLVRTLPACRHVFHRRCIDEWLTSGTTCPFCRAEVSTAESFVLLVGDEMEEGSNESVAAARDRQHRRSSSLIWPSDSRMMSFREKLGLKRCVSLESRPIRVFGYSSRS